MFSAVRKIRYQLRAGKRLYYAALWGIVSFYILFTFLGWYAENGDIVLSRSMAIQLVGLFLPFNSIFIVIPVLNEIWISDNGEILFAFRRKLYKIIILNDVLYFIGILGLFAIMVKMYSDILPCYINVLFLCLYLQILTWFLMPSFCSDLLVIGILLFYLVYSMLCLSGVVGAFAGGYVSGIELEFTSFIRQQAWKAVCIIVAGVVIRKHGGL